MCSAKIPSLPAAQFSGNLCSRDLILKLLRISSSIPSKLLRGFIFWCTKLPITQFFDEFSNAEKCFLHMTVTASFPVSALTADGSHDFLLKIVGSDIQSKSETTHSVAHEPKYLVVSILSHGEKVMTILPLVRQN